MKDEETGQQELVRVVICFALKLWKKHDGYHFTRKCASKSSLLESYLQQIPTKYYRNKHNNHNNLDRRRRCRRRHIRLDALDRTLHTYLQPAQEEVHIYMIDNFKPLKSFHGWSNSCKNATSTCRRLLQVRRKANRNPLWFHIISYKAMNKLSLVPVTGMDWTPTRECVVLERRCHCPVRLCLCGISRMDSYYGAQQDCDINRLYALMPFVRDNTLARLGGICPRRQCVETRWYGYDFAKKCWRNSKMRTRPPPRNSKPTYNTSYSKSGYWSYSSV